jgi:hypothetical protein
MDDRYLPHLRDALNGIRASAPEKKGRLFASPHATGMELTDRRPALTPVADSQTVGAVRARDRNWTLAPDGELVTLRVDRGRPRGEDGRAA